MLKYEQYKNMKTKMKRQGSNELPRFAVGALAIAGASAANGATVQISFNNSYISSTSGNNLDADFGNDGTAEIEGEWGARSAQVWDLLDGELLGTAVSFVFAPGVYAVGAGGGFGFTSNIGSSGLAVTAGGLVAVTFSDFGIRSGAPTLGYLDMTASATARGEKRITVNRLIFDQDTGGTIAGLDVNTTYATYVASAVPEPSSLGLLALGAGGLLARRRRQAA
jgi:hypothetical protein